MRVDLDLRAIPSFLALLFVMGEAHEIVHTGVGRLICGCWGPRDFNVWELCGNCMEETPLAILSTVAGPVFTFGMMWWGFSLLRPSRSAVQKSVGFCLVFANMPFARIFTAALGGGDEVYVLHHLFDGAPSSLLWGVGLAIVVLLSGPPLYRAFTVLSSRGRWALFTGFLVVPFGIYLLVVLGLMNTLLDWGVLDQSGLIGSPLLLNLWTLFWVGLLATSWTPLQSVLIPPPETEAT